MKVILLPLLALAACAQSDPGVTQGRALFRSNCAFCHGLTARGGRGPNLVSAPLHHGSTEADIKQVIRNGVTGSTMPAFSGFAEDDLDHLVLFLKSLSRGTETGRTSAGDPRLGRIVYVKNGCPGCHRIGFDGSVYGPDLSRIGTARPVEYLRESIVNPSADIQPEYEGVTVILKSGKRVSGIRLNEDTFTVQLRTPEGSFAGYSKDDLGQVVNETKSLMPAYSSLPGADLANLVAYLATLQGPAAGAAKEAESMR